MLRIGIYTRVSSTGQLDGHSLQTQLERLKELADAQFAGSEYELAIYEEEGLSGTLPPAQMTEGVQTKQRPALTRLLADAEAGQLDAVLFYSVSRLAREEAVFFPAKKKLDNLGVPYRFLDADVDPATDEGALLIGILGIFAATQLRQHKRRIKDAFAKRREEGYTPGGQPPYGLMWQQRDDVPKGGRRGWVQDQHAARWAKWMQERYTAGWTTTKIAEEATRLGVARPSGSNARWDSSAVRKVLVNPFLAGLITHPDGSLTEGQHYEERLWDPEERELMVKRLTRNRKVGSTTVKSTHFPLSGIVTCGHCGARLHGRTNNTGKRFYMCSTQHQHGKEACVGVSRLADPIEKAVTQTIRELATMEHVRDLATEETLSLLNEEKGRLVAHRQDLARERTRTQESIDRLTDMRIAGELTVEQYRVQNDRLWQHCQDLVQQIEEVDRQVEEQNSRHVELETARETLQNFNAVWDALDPDEQQEALRTVIEYAKLEPADGKDLLLRLKVVFLPEKQIPMPSYIKRKTTSGLGSLSPRDLAYLWHKRAGLDDRAIARLWDTTKQNAITRWRGIKKRLDVQTVEKAIEQAADRLDTEKHALPLLGRVNKRADKQVKFAWTKKRRQILAGLVADMPAHELAQSLGICTKTLSERIRRMKRHAGVKTVAELLAWARQAEIIDADA